MLSRTIWFKQCRFQIWYYSYSGCAS